MALTLSGTNGVGGACFTVDASGVSVTAGVGTFSSAVIGSIGAGVIIQVRHIGFSGASSQSVTGFYGRTGKVSLKNTDNVSVNNLTVAGNLDVTGD